MNAVSFVGTWTTGSLRTLAGESRDCAYPHGGTTDPATPLESGCFYWQAHTKATKAHRRCRRTVSRPIFLADQRMRPALAVKGLR